MFGIYLFAHRGNWRPVLHVSYINPNDLHHVWCTMLLWNMKENKTDCPLLHTTRVQSELVECKIRTPFHIISSMLSRHEKKKI